MTDDDLGTPYLRFTREGSVARVTIDRPDRRNALTPAMYFGIRRAVDRLNASHSLAALVITGTGDVFAPGGEMGGQHDDGSVAIGAQLGTDILPFEAVRRSAKPVVAMVNGLCMGGGLLITMMCDLAVVSERAVFRIPEVLRGVVDTNYATYLPPTVGVARARDLILTGRKFDAREAHAMGLVARVVPHDELEAATVQAVGEILQGAPNARRELKRIVNAQYGMVDRMTFDASLASDEVVEGFTAFVEKRTPSWVPDEFRGTDRL
jgi:enoyl-CoA hydratase